ncbi:hypothetical protein DsansV1_C07g0074231 [Dioscorea sansibarensis]
MELHETVITGGSPELPLPWTPTLLFFSSIARCGLTVLYMGALRSNNAVILKLFKRKPDPQ